MAKGTETYVYRLKDKNFAVQGNDPETEYTINSENQENGILTEIDTASFETMYVSDSRDEELATLIQNSYSKIGRDNRGVKQGNLLVLRKIQMPSVLTEIGFISSPSERKYLNSKKGQEQIAQAIFEGVEDYLAK